MLKNVGAANTMTVLTWYALACESYLASTAALLLMSRPSWRRTCRGVRTAAILEHDECMRRWRWWWSLVVWVEVVVVVVVKYL